MPTDTNLKQLVINLLTQAQYSQATIPANELCFLTDETTFEEVSNKVTSISSSSTDDEYPSAKCVYYIVGDIETLLQGI